PGLPLLPEDRHHAVRREPARPLILLSLPALWTVTISFTGVGGWLGKAAQDHGEPHSLRRRSGAGGPSSLELSIDAERHPESSPQQAPRTVPGWSETLFGWAIDHAPAERSPRSAPCFVYPAGCPARAPPCRVERRGAGGRRTIS